MEIYLIMNNLILIHKVVNFTDYSFHIIPIFLHNLVLLVSIHMFLNDLMTKYHLPFLLYPDSLINQSDTIKNTKRKINRLLNHLG